jgi:threonine/homoserine/homoserine lactone efflux protein
MRIVLPLMHRRRHPLAQAFSLVLGLFVFGLLMVFGLMVAGVLLVGGAVWLVWRQWKLTRAAAKPSSTPSRKPRQPEVLEGEYVVIRQSRPVTH